MNLIAQLLTPSHVIVELDATSKKRVLSRSEFCSRTHCTLHITKSLIACSPVKNWVLPDSVKVLQFRMAGLRGYAMLLRHLFA